MNKCNSTHVTQHCVEADGKTFRTHCIICGEPADPFVSCREQLLETGLDEELVKSLTDAEVLVAAKYVDTEFTSAVGGEVVKLIIEQFHSNSCIITEDYIQVILDSIYSELSDLISEAIYYCIHDENNEK
jgi:hypothetical protein